MRRHTGDFSLYSHLKAFLQCLQVSNWVFYVQSIIMVISGRLYSLQGIGLWRNLWVGAKLNMHWSPIYVGTILNHAKLSFLRMSVLTLHNHLFFDCSLQLFWASLPILRWPCMCKWDVNVQLLTNTHNYTSLKSQIYNANGLEILVLCTGPEALIATYYITLQTVLVWSQT